MKHTSFDRIIRRKRRVSRMISGTKERPRISVNRSNRFIYAQAIDDVARTTIVSVSSFLTRKTIGKKDKKTIEAKQVGIALGKKLIEAKVKQAVFDRGQYAYSGRVKAVAEGLREAGIKI